MITHRISQVLFWIQVVGGLVLSIGQFVGFLKSTEGQTMSMLLLMEVFIALHLALALSSYKSNPTPIKKQSVRIYQMWVVLIGSNAGLITVKFFQGVHSWNQNDTITTLIAVIGSVIVFIFSGGIMQAIQGNASKAFLAMACKAVPQFLLGLNIYQEGNKGIIFSTIISAHVTALTRIAQISLMIRDSGWDKSNKWLLISEIVNELSWIVVTIVWYFV